MSNLRLITAPCVGVLIIAVGLGLLVHSDLSSLPFTSSWTGKATNEKQKAMEGIGGNSDPTLVVVGSSFAGTTAALAAAQEDAALNIIMLEKEERTGGNSMKASSGINAVSIEHGDSIETFAKDTLASGGGLSDPALVQTLVNDSREALE